MEGRRRCTMKITTEMAWFERNSPAYELLGKVRAFTNAPGAWFELGPEHV
jgi:methionyl-tRNA formyltransferase